MGILRILSAVAALVVSGVASATPVTSAVFDFDASQGSVAHGVRSYTVGSGPQALTVSISAWSLGSQGFTAASTGWHGANWGLGICSSGENCKSSPTHGADSSGNDEFFLFRFSRDVTLRGLELRQIDNRNDADFAWASGRLDGGMAGRGLSQVLQDLSDSLSTRELRQNGASVQSFVGEPAAVDLLIGAQAVGKDRRESFFKLLGLTVSAPLPAVPPVVTPPSAPVPVPGSLALLGIAALGLGANLRRRPA